MKNTSEKFHQGIFQGFSAAIKSLEALNGSKCLNITKKLYNNMQSGSAVLYCLLRTRGADFCAKNETAVETL